MIWFQVLHSSCGREKKIPLCNLALPHGRVNNRAIMTIKSYFPSVVGRESSLTLAFPYVTVLSDWFDACFMCSLFRIVLLPNYFFIRKKFPSSVLLSSAALSSNAASSNAASLVCWRFADYLISYLAYGFWFPPFFAVIFCLSSSLAIIGFRWFICFFKLFGMNVKTHLPMNM